MSQEVQRCAHTLLFVVSTGTTQLAILIHSQFHVDPHKTACQLFFFGYQSAFNISTARDSVNTPTTHFLVTNNRQKLKDIQHRQCFISNQGEIHWLLLVTFQQAAKLFRNSGRICALPFSKTNARHWRRLLLEWYLTICSFTLECFMMTGSEKPLCNN